MDPPRLLENVRKEAAFFPDVLPYLYRCKYSSVHVQGVSLFLPPSNTLSQNPEKLRTQEHATSKQWHSLELAIPKFTKFLVSAIFLGWQIQDSAIILGW